MHAAAFAAKNQVNLFAKCPVSDQEVKAKVSVKKSVKRLRKQYLRLRGGDLERVLRLLWCLLLSLYRSSLLPRSLLLSLLRPVSTPYADAEAPYALTAPFAAAMVGTAAGAAAAGAV